MLLNLPNKSRHTKTHTVLLPLQKFWPSVGLVMSGRISVLDSVVLTNFTS